MKHSKSNWFSLYSKFLLIFLSMVFIFVLSIFPLLSQKKMLRIAFVYLNFDLIIPVS